MKKQIITTNLAPEAIGPYSQAVRSGNIIFISGQIPLDPATGVMVEGGIKEQTKRVLENLRAVINEAGGELEDLLKTTVYLSDLSDFQDMNAVYADYFAKNPPARATVQVSALPKNALVEIDAIATL